MFLQIWTINLWKKVFCCRLGAPGRLWLPITPIWNMVLTFFFAWQVTFYLYSGVHCIPISIAVQCIKMHDSQNSVMRKMNIEICIHLSLYCYGYRDIMGIRIEFRMSAVIQKKEKVSTMFHIGEISIWISPHLTNTDNKVNGRGNSDVNCVMRSPHLFQRHTYP